MLSNSSAAQRKRVDPLSALCALMSVIAACYLLDTTPELGIFALGVIAGLGWQTRFSTANLTIISWVLPFCVPLFLIHGVLNSSFPVSLRIAGFIPWRQAGFNYGALVGMRMFLIAIAAMFWAQTKRDEVIEALIRLKLPLWAVLFLAQGVAVGALVERRILRVYQAQQARGIKVGPDFLSRVRAFPVILIPTVITTLLEADARAPALTSRGFGSGQILPIPHLRRNVLDSAVAVYPLILLLVEIALRST